MELADQQRNIEPRWSSRNHAPPPPQPPNRRVPFRSHAPRQALAPSFQNRCDFDLSLNMTGGVTVLANRGDPLRSNIQGLRINATQLDLRDSNVSVSLARSALIQLRRGRTTILGKEDFCHQGRMQELIRRFQAFLLYTALRVNKGGYKLEL